MILKTKGISSNIISPIVGRVTRMPSNNDGVSILLVDDDAGVNYFDRYSGVLSSLGYRELGNIPQVHSIPDLNHLSEGDIVVINSDGVINTLYRVNSNHNSILVTERCNSNCLMCSQPPKDKNDIEYLFAIHEQLIPLIPKDCIELGITGGEPTLLGSRFFKLLELIKVHLPDTEIHCLTNGRTFAWNNMVRELEKLNYQKLMLGIPIYSDYHAIHDYVVQAKDAFNQTVRGLYNLAEIGQRIELRIVLHKQTVPRLTKLAKYIYKNLPFVEHVAFMGLEYIGYTPHNIDKLWIDPFEYNNDLEEAVEYLSSFGMNVSIYNSQLCVMPENLWQYARKSISDWKNEYLPECQQCTMLNECGGLFSWNLKKYSTHIKALT